MQRNRQCHGGLAGKLIGMRNTLSLIIVQKKYDLLIYRTYASTIIKQVLTLDARRRGRINWETAHSASAAASGRGSAVGLFDERACRAAGRYLGKGDALAFSSRNLSRLSRRSAHCARGRTPGNRGANSALQGAVRTGTAARGGSPRARPAGDQVRVARASRKPEPHRVRGRSRQSRFPTARRRRSDASSALKKSASADRGPVRPACQRIRPRSTCRRARRWRQSRSAGIAGPWPGS